MTTLLERKPKTVNRKPGPFLWALFILMFTLLAPDFDNAFVLAVVKPLLGCLAFALVLINLKSGGDEEDS